MDKGGKRKEKMRYFVITGASTYAKRTTEKNNLSTLDVTSFLTATLFRFFLSAMDTESIKEATYANACEVDDVNASF